MTVETAKMAPYKPRRKVAKVDAKVKKARETYYRKNKAKVLKAAKAYYKKNKKEILHRAKIRRAKAK